MNKTLTIGALVAAALAGPVCAQDPMTVTSDTPEYCLGLASRMEAAGEMPSTARTLWERGRAMCEQGQVRRGLVRLRRAMVMLHGAPE